MLAHDSSNCEFQINFSIQLTFNFILIKAALGYRSDEFNSTYSWKCGGSVISPIFILTGVYLDACFYLVSFPLNFHLFIKPHIAKMTERAEIPSLRNWESFIFMITAQMHKLLMFSPSHRILSIRVAKSITTSL